MHKVKFLKPSHSNIGIEGSFRGKKDGITFFGCKKRLKPLEGAVYEGNEIVNDFIIRNKDPETNDRHRGRHFQIEYYLESNSFKIRDLGVGFGAFIRIDGPLLLKDNNLISMGSSFLIINLDDEKEALLHGNGGDKMPKVPNYLGIEDAQSKNYAQNKKIGNNYSEITVKIFGGPNYGEVQ
jgi:hypothetical protein